MESRNLTTLAAAAAAAASAFLLGIKYSYWAKNKSRKKIVLDDDGDYVGVQSGVLNLDALVDIVSDPGVGAISTFIGVTRDNFEGKEVVRLDYECYDSMAVKEMKKICRKIREKWDVKYIAIQHRLGTCPVKEASIIIVVSSAHREASLDATKFAINTLKATVPIWKKEVYSDDKPIWKENKEFRQSINS